MGWMTWQAIFQYPCPVRVDETPRQLVCLAGVGLDLEQAPRKFRANGIAHATPLFGAHHHHYARREL
jgi:hypothetical protein